MSHIEPHDEFLELCAVSTSGQLTEEEQKKLQEHLAICRSCRDAIEQYEAVVRDAIPIFAADETPAAVEPGPDWSQDRAETALFNRIAKETVGGEPAVSPTKLDDAHGHRNALPFGGEATWNHVWTLCAAAILLAMALGICVYQVGVQRGTNSAKLIPLPVINQSQPPLEAQLSDASHQRVILREDTEQRDRLIGELRKKLEQQSSALKREQRSVDLRTRDSEKQGLIQPEVDTTQELERGQAAQALQQKLDGLVRDSVQKDSQAAQLEYQIKELSQALHDRDAELEQKDDLLAKDRDVRELIGARDLYVAEVYDVARTGETRKAYGRVFYTKGKSLIFYAYDLDQDAALKNVGTFQAWGRRGPDRQQALNLGIFYEDNASKKRWILKLNDSEMLAQIDAVFVTMEPHGGSQKPSTKPFLFAYLKTDPNHP